MRRTRIFRKREDTPRRYVDSPFDKNTSRNQITHHPTYRRFPINVEESRQEIYRRQEKQQRKNEGESERER